MPKYENGKIYKIVCNITGDIYIGSTTQKLSSRLTQHVRDSKKIVGATTKSKDIILRGNYDIVLIENFSCNNGEELHRKEREHIESIICVNKVIPTRTHKEYNDSHKEERDKYSAEYWIKHKEEITEKRKEKGIEYRIKTKEDKKEYDRKYREKNKELIKQKKN
jgi:hypothetical protein